LLPEAGQTFVTATDAVTLDQRPDQLVQVAPGKAE
jgi:hypothetical protein